MKHFPNSTPKSWIWMTNESPGTTLTYKGCTSYLFWLFLTTKICLGIRYNKKHMTYGENRNTINLAGRYYVQMQMPLPMGLKDGISKSYWVLCMWKNRYRVAQICSVRAKWLVSVRPHSCHQGAVSSHWAKMWPAQKLYKWERCCC